MKKFIALAVLATATASFAASDIYDIQYLPAAGTTYGFSTGEYFKGEIETDNGDAEISGPRFVQTIGHSFTDRLSLSASLNYQDLESDPDGGSKSTTSGISDPKVEARFRMMDEAFRWDLVGGAVVSLGDSEVEEDGDSDNLQGGHSLIIGTQLGVKSESFQWSILGQLTHNMESTTDYDGFGKLDDDSHNELLVRGDILNKLAEKSLLRSHLSIDFTEGYDDEEGDESAAPLTTYEIGTEYQHLLSQDLLLRAGVDYQMLNTSSAQIDNISAWLFRVGANYQF